MVRNEPTLGEDEPSDTVPEHLGEVDRRSVGGMAVEEKVDGALRLHPPLSGAEQALADAALATPRIDSDGKAGWHLEPKHAGHQ